MQARTHPKLARDYPYNEMTEKYWMKDVDSLYEERKRFDWYRPNIVGGKSIMWGRQCYRFSDIDFEANAKEGIGVDWPIRYQDIAPWYSHVEKFAGISGEALGLPQLPDSEFLPPMDMFFVEKEVRKRIEKAYPNRNMTIGRVANLSKTFDNESFPGTVIHEMGTARMGRDPKTSILNAHNQIHTVKNVFMTDGACMTSAVCVNPSLTFMALTARAADHAVAEMKRGNL